MTTTNISDEWKRTPGKKNTRRWCRGKVGVEHEWTRKPFREAKRWVWASESGWEVDVCDNCGKFGQHYNIYASFVWAPK